jgi:DNA-binding NtrC family response regulator
MSPDCASPGQVLLVEDDPGISAMLRGVLELHDFTVTSANCQAQAIEALRANAAIDVVMLDLGLPPLPYQISEGIATLRAIGAEFMAAKVIVLTGQDQREAALEAVREGAFDFLAKPAAGEPITRAVARAMLFVRNEQMLLRQGVTRIAINAQFGEGLKGVRDNAEGTLVRHVLKETGFNVYKSAKRLGVKRENVYYLMKKFGIERHD